MAKKSNEEYYSHILINKMRRWSLIFTFVIFYIIFIAILFENLARDRQWYFAIVPIVLFGLPLMFFPASEEWEYRPWQAKPVKYEFHQRD